MSKRLEVAMRSRRPRGTVTDILPVDPRDPEVVRARRQSRAAVGGKSLGARGSEVAWPDDLRGTAGPGRHREA